MSRNKLHHTLYFQVLLAIVLGAALGALAPDWAIQMKPLGDGFIKLIKMVIAPIVFATVVVGIAGMGDMRKLGRVGLKTLIYFEVVTTLALVIGLVVARTFQPGAGMNADVSKLDVSAVAGYAETARTSAHGAEFFLNMIPSSVVDAFAKGEILQVLVFSVLFGLAIVTMGERGRPIVSFCEQLSHAFFQLVGLIMKLAPVGAFGAMAFTVGKFGIGTLLSLGKLMACVYLTCGLFVALVLGAIARAAGFRLLQLLKLLKDELLIVLGTSSSESVLPRLMDKLEKAGASRSVVGLVVPTGYSFNLDGTSIYLTMAALFIAQATNTPLTLGQELTLLGVLLLTSKGAATVTGGGFVTLAATLASLHTLPVAGLALLLGVDRFMSEARALTNMVGNAVATLVVARWEGELDTERLAATLDGREPEAPVLPLDDQFTRV